LREALADTPVVLFHGPRQCGKTTLARIVGQQRNYAYFSFVDDAAGNAAEQDPGGAGSSNACASPKLVQRLH
jgi:predicted AAA+ superfamily ATPase